MNKFCLFLRHPLKRARGGGQVLCIALLFSSSSLLAINLTREIDLQGEWLFEIGDNLEYARPDYNDAKWVRVHVPSPWENEGFPGYDSYGWYRVTFTVPRRLNNKVLYLQLGQIDDVDRTYLNGQFINGVGDFPPSYQTAYDVNRLYEIPSNFIAFGKKNTLAVRVYDSHGVGGIVHGDVGIYSREDVIDLQIDLSGLWKFKTGDEWQWGTVDYDDANWKSIAVPGTWEQQGYPNHDGYGWYRISTRISKSLAKEKLILMLGKINDVDEAYFNGARIGQQVEFPIQSTFSFRGFKDIERAYFIPPYLIKTNAANIIAVRVYDAGKSGGIYSGYIGITTRDDYLKYSRKKK
ncbi:glycoside hydrolase [candidate division KSB1 bacterium]|nr:glycoside hydrolase [candidate division KSB1 bacterium]RQW11442.1 MAG: glycoside hydrolase [candidate division KSB1 bacterium]